MQFNFYFATINRNSVPSIVQTTIPALSLQGHQDNNLSYYNQMMMLVLVLNILRSKFLAALLTHVWRMLYKVKLLVSSCIIQTFNFDHLEEE